MPMITTAAWVPRGFAAPVPTKYQFDEEFGRIAELAKLRLDDAQGDLNEAQAGVNGAEHAENGKESVREKKARKKASNEATNANEDDVNDVEMNHDDLKEYNLDTYDDDDDDTEDQAEGQEITMFGNIKSLAYHESNKDDPYITIKDEDDDDEEEDLRVVATDNLLLAAKVEDELAHLEVYVYEDEADNLYVHHDIILPAIPLCVEWLDIPVQKPAVEKDAVANFVAVGTMDPDIEIWDLDMVDCMHPNAVLSQCSQAAEATKKKKKKKKGSKKANDEYHVDAVLSLAANRKHRNLLASASADQTIKLWDLHTIKCAQSYSFHEDKVCSVAWHPVESTVLLSGSYDRTVAAADMRAPGAQVRRVGVESDVENVQWDPHDSNCFFVSTELGAIHYFDARSASTDPASSKPMWTLQAHDESVSSFHVNPIVPGYLATGSSDTSVKLWNIQPTGPSMVVSRNVDVGKVFSTTFAPDSEVAFRLAVAGSKGSVAVWDTSTNAAVRRAFAEKVPARSTGSKAVEDRLVSIDDADDDESDSSEEENGEGVACR